MKQVSVIGLGYVGLPPLTDKKTEKDLKMKLSNKRSIIQVRI